MQRYMSEYTFLRGLIAFVLKGSCFGVINRLSTQRILIRCRWMICTYNFWFVLMIFFGSFDNFRVEQRTDISSSLVISKIKSMREILSQIRMKNFFVKIFRCCNYLIVLYPNLNLMVLYKKYICMIISGSFCTLRSW